MMLLGDGPLELNRGVSPIFRAHLPGTPSCASTLLTFARLRLLIGPTKVTYIETIVTYMEIHATAEAHINLGSKMGPCNESVKHQQNENQ